MSAPSNTFITTNAVGIRESLHDRIYMLNKDEVPFQASIGGGVALNTYEEWQTDTLGTANVSNWNLEGDDSTNVAITATVRVGNRTQIFKKVFQISRTEEQVKKAGRDSEISYQTAKQGRQLKMDIETSLLLNQASTGTDPRKLGGMLSWISSNVSRGTGGVSGGFSGSNTVAASNGTQRAFTESLLQTTVKSVWDNGGNGDILLVGSAAKQVASGFTGIATQFQDVKGKRARIVGAADVYISDFGELDIVPDRYMSTRDAIIVTTDMAQMLWLSKIKREELAKTGDATKYHLVCEGTLKINNEAAHGVIADLTP